VGAQPSPVLEGVLDGVERAHHGGGGGGAHDQVDLVSEGGLVVAVGSAQPVEGVLESGGEGEVVLRERDDHSVVLRDGLVEGLDLSRHVGLFLVLDVGLLSDVVVEVAEGHGNILFDEGLGVLSELLVDGGWGLRGSENQDFLFIGHCSCVFVCDFPALITSSTSNNCEARTALE